MIFLGTEKLQFRQLRRLESDLDPDKERSGDTNSGLSILTVDSAVSAQSDRESTFSTYDWIPPEIHIGSESVVNFFTACEIQD